MLKRILLAGCDDELRKALQASARDLHFEDHKEGPVPPGIVGVIASENTPEALDAVRAVADVQEKLLRLVADAVDCREGLIEGSAERLRDHAARFAQALKLSPGEQDTLERGALLHDIGKLRISNDVLLKKNVLDYDEWLLLHRHTHLGAELLLELGLFPDTIDIIRFHHECYDGTGYPDKLEGGEIPRLAHILKIVDVYCAMTSPRIYRSGHSTHEETIAYLKKERGKHYDPELIDVFLNKNVGQPLAAS